MRISQSSYRLGIVVVTVVLVWQCSNSSPSAPTTTPPLVENGFQVNVLTSGQGMSSSDIQRVVSRASTILNQKTGESMVIGEIIGSLGGSVSGKTQTHLQDKTAETSPDGVLVLTEDATATMFGGYSMTLPGPDGFVNKYPSPAVGDNRVYVAAVHWNHTYARCGYNDSDNHVSDVSIDGECFNSPETPCVQRGDRWVCSTALNDLYMESDYYNACTVVHEFLHPFGNEGNNDHYGSPACRSRTGITTTDRHEGQLNCQMCPDLYQRFGRR